MKFKVIGTVVLGMIALIGGILFFTLQQIPSGQATNIEEHLIHADMTIYKDISEVTASSSLIFEGTVEQILPASRIAPKDAAKSKGYLITNVVVRVGKVFHGPAEAANTTITIPHLGGQEGNVKYTAEGSPISEKGKSYLFFAKLGPDNIYRIVGDTQGRFLIQNGKLLPLSQEAENYPSGKTLNGMLKTDFERNFRALAKL